MPRQTNPIPIKTIRKPRVNPAPDTPPPQNDGFSLITSPVQKTDMTTQQAGTARITPPSCDATMSTRAHLPNSGIASNNKVSRRHLRLGADEAKER